MTESTACDVAIVGAGLAGRITALALKSAAGVSLDMRLLDAAKAERPCEDIRAYAIAAGTRRMLAALGVWDSVADAAQPVKGLDITDNRLEEIVRPVLLSFEEEAGEDEAFAHFVDARDLTHAVSQATRRAGIEPTWGSRIGAIDAGLHSARVETAAGRFSARLVVGADGTRSAVRRSAGIARVGWPYDQSAIVAIIRHELGHDGRAVQHFLPQGPFAMLPLPGDRSGIVWTVSSAEATRLMRLPPGDFAGEVWRAAGPERGWIELEEGPVAQKLELGMARRFAGHRVALVGDAAHRVHPLAGQGLNIGFRDVAALVEVVIEAARRGEDYGSVAVLERYQRWRRFDAVQFAATTDLLNRLFSNDSTPLRLVRDLGLGLVQRALPLKSRLIGEAAGRAGHLPRLLQGGPV